MFFLRNLTFKALVFAAVFAALSTSSKALLVATSIKPLYSLVSMVAGNVGTTTLIVKGNTSPHHIKLSTKNYYDINKADVVFIISKNLEAPIYKATQNKQKLYEAIKFPNLTLLDVDNSTILFKKGDNTPSKKVNIHIWLNPYNAQVIVKNVANILSAKDPKNAAIYQKNADVAVQKLENLITKVQKELNAISYNFLFYHNGFSYFEDKFKIASKGSLVTGTQANEAFGNLLSTKKLLALGTLLKEYNIKCVFTEPQFHDLVLLKFLKQHNIEHKELDPVGFNLVPNKDLYFTLIQNIANTISSCKY